MNEDLVASAAITTFVAIALQVGVAVVGGILLLANGRRLGAALVPGLAAVAGIIVLALLSPALQMAGTHLHDRFGWEVRGLVHWQMGSSLAIVAGHAVCLLLLFAAVVLGRSPAPPDARNSTSTA